ncbi:MAG: DUF3048 domain-containing protein [Candidatus Ozemobacteraceae bacterium]
MKMRYSTLIVLFFCSFLFLLETQPPAMGQGYGAMRRYLEIRDALTVLKAQMEKRLFTSPVVMPPAGAPVPFDLVQIKKQLHAAEAGISELQESQDPLSIYYRERLNVLLDETRTLLPIVEKRISRSEEAVSPAGGVQSAVVDMSVKPQAPPPGSMQQKPVVSTSKTEAVALLSPVMSKVKRREFFHPMGFRNLISRFFGKNAPKVTNPLNTSKAPESIKVQNLPNPLMASDPMKVLNPLNSPNHPTVTDLLKARNPSDSSKLNTVSVTPVSVPSASGLASASISLASSSAVAPITALPEPVTTTVQKTGFALPEIASSSLSGMKPVETVISSGSSAVGQLVTGVSGVLPLFASAGVPLTGIATSASMPVVVPISVAELPESTETGPYSMLPFGTSNAENPQICNSPAMRPLAIMIENHNQARPQTGLEEAEVVYEIPVEGGITRFMALFYHVAGVIGPIRSCRDYFIDRALEVNALYVHCGGSPQGYDHIRDTKALAIDEISNGEPYFRDNSRKAPHNLYSKIQSLIDYTAKKFPMELPYQRLPLRFGNTPKDPGSPNQGVTIKYHGNYSVAFRFNPRRNSYDRYMNGLQHLDRVSCRPISPGTIIVQEAAMKVIDEKGRQDISFIGQGKAQILFGGTIVHAIWRKNAIREFTEFFDQRGNPIIFSNDKPTWIQVVSPKNQVTFDPPIETAAAALPVPAKGNQ